MRPQECLCPLAALPVLQLQIGITMISDDVTIYTAK